MTFDQLIRLVHETNLLSRSIIGTGAFDEINVWLPDPRSPEPAFIKATSWLYCLYKEAGRVSITFLVRLGAVFDIIDKDRSDSHIETVRALRTDLHHNLAFEESDAVTRSAANHWKKAACGTAIPLNDNHWKACYDKLVADAFEFLQSINLVVRRLEGDHDESEGYRAEWLHTLNRSWPAAAFDPLVEDAKAQLGRQALNTVKFRNRHVERWRKQLDALNDEFDFNYEAARLIEKAMLDEDSVVLPIAAADLMSLLSLKPGPIVGKLLEEANRHFRATSCSKEDLLLHLKGYHQVVERPCGEP